MIMGMIVFDVDSKIKFLNYVDQIILYTLDFLQHELGDPEQHICPFKQIT